MSRSAAHRAHLEEGYLHCTAGTLPSSFTPRESGADDRDSTSHIGEFYEKELTNACITGSPTRIQRWTHRYWLVACQRFFRTEQG